MEEYNLKGKKYKIDSPLKDGWDLVKAKYPKALPEGSTAHWTYFVKDEKVGEAWMTRNCHWMLRVKQCAGSPAVEDTRRLENGR